MTRTVIALISTVALVVASSASLPAQGKKGSTPKPQQVSSKVKVSSPKTTTASVRTSATKTSGPKASAPRTTSVAQTSKGPKASTVKTTGKTKTTSSPSTRTARLDTKGNSKATRIDAKASAKTTRVDAKRTTAPTTTTTPTTGDTETPPVVLTRVQERLQKNTKLADRLESRLPRGTDLMEAADGFNNLGQFVAAVNVSGNLGLDFEKLKVAMVDDGKSLGQAIQTVKRDVANPTVVAQRAESEAQTLIKQTETAPTRRGSNR